MTDKPCLILLGEPGIGKTHALQQEQLRLTAAAEPVIPVNLGLRRERIATLIARPEWQQWHAGHATLTLLLDGFDEGGREAAALVEDICDTLARQPTTRLSLRITCRSGEWPNRLTQRLRELFGAEPPEKYRLALLTEDEIVQAARCVAADPEQFLELVKEKGAGPLAAKPVTLSLLLTLYQKHGGFPAHKAGLYHAGCLELCEEPDSNRLEEAEIYREHTWPDKERTLAVAGRIAAATVLANEAVIYLGKDAEAGLDIPLGSLIGGTEMVDGLNAIEIDRDQIRQALRTGLFTPRGDRRVGWTHRTFAEYLAAWRLREAPLKQIKLLLSHPSAPGRKLIPQLHAVAAWLAPQHADAFRWLARIAPELLLDADLSTVNAEARGVLLRSALSDMADGVLEPVNVRNYGNRLLYDGAAQDVLPYAVDAALPTAARRAAIDLAVQAKATAVVPALIATALDENGAIKVRQAAAHAVWHLGTSQQRRQLEPLARGGAGDDPDNMLRAYGLRCMWPEFWSLQEMIPHLGPTWDVDADYRLFVESELPATIPDHELLPSLQLITGGAGGLPDLLSGTCIDLLKRAWPLRTDGAARSVLARVILQLCTGLNWADDRSKDVARDLASRPEELRLFGLAWLTAPDVTGEDLESLVEHGLILPGDLPWLEAQQPRPAALADLRSLFAAGVTVHDYLRPRPPALQDEFPFDDEVMGPGPTVPPERVQQACDALDRGDWQPWVGLAGRLHLQPGKTDGAYAQAVAETARRFLSGVQPARDIDWGVAASPDLMAGYYSLRLLADADAFGTVPPEVWDAWAPAAVAVASPYDSRADDRVIREVMRRAPTSVEHCLRQLVTRGRTQGIENLHGCWTERLGQIVLAQLPNQQIPIRLLMASLLVEFNQPGYAEMLTDELDAWLAGTRPMSDWEVGITAILLGHRGETAWTLFKAVFNEPRGRPGDLCRILASNGPWPALPAGLADSTLAELYTVISTHLPPEMDPDPEPSISREHQGHVMADFRQRLLDGLARRGNEQAIDALHELGAALPSQRTLLAEALDRAEAQYRRTNWQPPGVRDVVETLQQPTRRTVTTAEQLIAVILEALEKIQHDLRGAWAPVKALWNRSPVRPVSENEFSDFIAYLLHKELGAGGVIVNREVEIRPGRGGEKVRQAGERVDLTIQTWPKGTERSDTNALTVIVEVKGCWHRHVHSAMKDQLVDVYLLENNHCRHAIYLVGWFLCDAWDGRWDRRKGRARTNWPDIDKASHDLQRQADQLCLDGVNVATFVMDVRLTTPGRVRRRYRSGKRAITKGAS